MMKATFLKILILGLILGLFPLKTLGVVIFEDNFDNYNTGNLSQVSNGVWQIFQNYKDCLVVNNNYYSPYRAVKENENGFCGNYLSGINLGETGKAKIKFKITSRYYNNGTILGIVNNQNDFLGHLFYDMGGRIVYYYKSGTSCVWAVFFIPNAGTWYDLTLEWKKEEGFLFVKYSYNGTSTNWLEACYSETTPQKVLIGASYNMTAGYDIYLDDFVLEAPKETGYYGDLTFSNLNCGYNQVQNPNQLNLKGKVEVPLDGEEIQHLFFEFYNLKTGKTYRNGILNFNCKSGETKLFDITYDISSVLSTSTDLISLTAMAERWYIDDQGNFRYDRYYLNHCKVKLGLTQTPDLTPPEIITSMPYIPSKEELKEDCSDPNLSFLERISCQFHNLMIDIFYPSKENIEKIIQKKELLKEKFPVNFFVDLSNFFNEVKTGIGQGQITFSFFGSQRTIDKNFYQSIPVLGDVFNFIKLGFNSLMIFGSVVILKKEFDFLIKSLS